MWEGIFAALFHTHTERESQSNEEHTSAHTAWTQRQTSGTSEAASLFSETRAVRNRTVPFVILALSPDVVGSFFGPSVHLYLHTQLLHICSIDSREQGPEQSGQRTADHRVLQCSALSQPCNKQTCSLSCPCPPLSTGPVLLLDVVGR